MSFLSTIDDQVVNELTPFMGTKPEFYLYVVQGPALWLTLLMAGGLLAAMFQKPFMLGYAKEKFFFLPTSIWNTGTFKKEGSFSIAKSDIASVSSHKFLVANYITLTLKNGKKIRLVANTLYKKLAKQSEGIDQFKKILGV